MGTRSKIRIGRLDTVGYVACEIARVYRAMRRGEIEMANGERLARVLTMLRQGLEISDIEKRLAELEALTDGR